MVFELSFVYIIHRRGLYRKIKIDDTFLSMSYFQQFLLTIFTYTLLCKTFSVCRSAKVSFSNETGTEFLVPIVCINVFTALSLTLDVSNLVFRSL